VHDIKDVSSMPCLIAAGGLASLAQYNPIMTRIMAMTSRSVGAFSRRDIVGCAQVAPAVD
jgi:hypothetical protein